MTNPHENAAARRKVPVPRDKVALPPAILPLPAGLLCLLVLLGCPGGKTTPSDVAVDIDGEHMRYSHFESYVRASVDPEVLPLGPKVLEKLFDQFIDEQLLIRLAADRGLPVDAGVDQRDALAYLLRSTEVTAGLDAEVAAYYEEHREEYQRTERVQLEQILVYERGEAVRAEQALAAGEEFADVAARFSQVPLQQGDQGRLAHEDLPSAFADAIFALEPGEVSAIFTADYGFHIFRVAERFPAEEVPLEAVAGEIRRLVERRLLDEAVAAFIEEARGRYDVRIHLSNFPFEYRGTYDN
jgi:hypothetical protein